MGIFLSDSRKGAENAKILHRMEKKWKGMERKMNQNRRGKRAIVWYILAGMNLLLFLLLGMQYTKRSMIQQGIAEKVLRFHVLANSDSEEDQKLKLAVRDAVGRELAGRLSGIEERDACEEVIQSELGAVTAIAEDVIAAEGYDYPVEAYLDEMEFPVKSYGDYTFPAGRYLALRVVIGEGAGHNWWCVMYPNMCFSGSVYEVVDEEAGEQLRKVLSKEEYEQVLNSGEYEVQFKYLSFLNGTGEE